MVYDNNYNIVVLHRALLGDKMRESKLRFWGVYITGIVTLILLSIHFFMLFANNLNFDNRISTPVVDEYLSNSAYYSLLGLLLVVAFIHGLLGVRRSLYDFGIKKGVKDVKIGGIIILLVLLFFYFTT
ncbi:succinate dehydrogenase subunit [Acidianus hospitalis W1]|uniref:Succinate dehydrogenase subunit n=2 Tax=Acidianus hospitalis TaxID=563177 RepID=F4B4X3_ACIHW|nr:succinate dehydrogenase subunit [Acidianus hospitalis W1]